MALPEMRLLESALGWAEELHSTKAAKRLNIEPSTLSHRIDELEACIDHQYFSLGRISMAPPRRAAGIFAATAIASSMLSPS
jgi:DNA-binding transcriptional LysR family regulator